MYVSIGSDFEILFTLESDLVDLTGSDPRILISFPIRYLPRLNRDEVVSCAVNSEEVSCYLVEDRLLEIRYFSTAIMKTNKFELIVRGVTQPLTYSAGVFYIYFDALDSDSNVEEYCLVADDKISTSIAARF